MMSLQKRKDNKRKKTTFSDKCIKRTANNNKKAENFCYSFYLLADDGKIFFNSSFIFSVILLLRPHPRPTRCKKLLSPGRSVCRNFFWFQSRKWGRLEISFFVCCRKLHKIKNEIFPFGSLAMQTREKCLSDEIKMKFLSSPIPAFDMAIVHNTAVVTQGWWRT